MKVLAVNCGSATLKFALFDAGDASGERRLAHGVIDKVGGHGSAEFCMEQGRTVQQTATVDDTGEAIRQVLAWLKSSALLEPEGLGAVGHRVVHGGVLFTEPALIDDGVITAIESLSELAPLHNGPSLAAIRSARSALGAAVPMVAVFDTAFHRTLPPWAAHYAIPHELAEKHRIRRYGFHGLAHRFMTERYARLAAAPLDQVKLVTLQLGNGCSAAAVAAGRSVDTSMGFTPLEGLVMGTRSGDIDPSVVSFLTQREGVDAAEVEGWLNRRSGLLGVSGSSKDMRELLERERQGDARAALAVEMFCYRVRKYLGAYLAALGGADAVVFGGGIGENAPSVRARICEGMDWCGLTLDPERNAARVGTEGLIGVDGGRIRACVIPVDEAALIAGDTLRCLQQQRGG
jgi:acetate kinase